MKAKLKKIGSDLEAKFKVSGLSLYYLEKKTGLQGKQIRALFSGENVTLFTYLKIKNILK